MVEKCATCGRETQDTKVIRAFGDDNLPYDVFICGRCEHLSMGAYAVIQDERNWYRGPLCKSMVRSMARFDSLERAFLYWCNYAEKCPDERKVLGPWHRARWALMRYGEGACIYIQGIGYKIQATLPRLNDCDEHYSAVRLSKYTSSQEGLNASAKKPAQVEPGAMQSVLNRTYHEE